MKPLLVAWDFFGVINELEPYQASRMFQQILDLSAEQIIVSHSSQAEIEHYLEITRLRQYFVAIYGAEWHMIDSGLGKAPALTDYLTHHGPFAKKYMIGDSLSDMSDARQAGLQAVLYDSQSNYQNVEDEADYKIAEASELLSIIQGDHDA